MNGRKTFEKEHFNINIARLKKGGENFEINIDPDLAIDFKEGKNIDIKDVLKSEEIFFDVKDGKLASETIMKELFGTIDSLVVAKKILENGEIQLTAEHRNKIEEQKMKKLINIIHKNAINPKTNLPHPVQRIENAILEKKIKLKQYVPVEDQVQDIVKSLQTVLPIKFDHKKVEITVDAKYAHSVYAIVKKYGQIKDNNWLNDGSWYGVVDIPAGLQTDFFDDLNSATRGAITTKLID